MFSAGPRREFREKDAARGGSRKFWDGNVRGTREATRFRFETRHGVGFVAGNATTTRRFRVKCAAAPGTLPKALVTPLHRIFRPTLQ